MPARILCIAGPTASGKTSRAVEEALAHSGEVISVDSRQVYRTLDIGTEKISQDEMRGVPHHLIDIREPEASYSAGDFLADATRLIGDISARGKLPILAGGTHYYFDVLMKGLPLETPPNRALRAELELLSDEELFARVQSADAARAAQLDPKNRRRLVRALEIIAVHGSVPPRSINVRPDKDRALALDAEWIVIDPEAAVLRERIDTRLRSAFERGLTDEVRRVRERVGDVRLAEFGLEYRVVGEYLRDERTEASILPALRAQLWQYARRQKAWLRKLRDELIAAA